MSSDGPSRPYSSQRSTDSSARGGGGRGPAPRRGGPSRGGDRGGSASRGPGGRGFAGKRFKRRKYCRFSAEHIEYIDYKNYRLLREMLTERGKIKPRGATGTNAKFQRMLTTAVKRARQMALISPTKL